MSPIQYFDFDLSIEPVKSLPRVYYARVLNSPAGQAEHQFELPISDGELEKYLSEMNGQLHNTLSLDPPEGRTVAEFGHALSKAIFDSPIGVCLLRSWDGAKQQKYGLRIRLRLANDPILLNLPWEYLYDASHNRFFSHSSRTPIVRYLDLPHGRIPLTVQPPLKLLVVISNPSGYEELGVEQEWAKVHNAIASLEKQGLVKIQRLKTATLPELQETLRQDSYHILHFIGHGYFDEHLQESVLFWEGEDGRSQAIDSYHLGIMLHDHSSLRLCILNACEGARTSSTEPFAGVAQHLIQQGIPAVVAMQFAITDLSAIKLSQAFYSALTDGYPVDAALAEARKAIYKVNDIEWGIPVLYMQAEDGVLFNLTDQPVKLSPLSNKNYWRFGMMILSIIVILYVGMGIGQTTQLSQWWSAVDSLERQATAISSMESTSASILLHSTPTTSVIPARATVTEETKVTNIGNQNSAKLLVPTPSATATFTPELIETTTPSATPTQTQPETSTATSTATPRQIQLSITQRMLTPNAAFTSQQDKIATVLVGQEFMIDKYETTNQEYSECVSAGICTKPINSASNTVYRSYEEPKFTDYPAIVTWRQAVDYCSYRGKRLPTEAEWVYAATGCTIENDACLQEWRYPWGNARPTCKHANFYRWGKYCNDDKTLSPVGRYLNGPTRESGASQFDAIDMAGNVWEWTCKDSNCNTYVKRGGDWNTPGIGIQSRLFDTENTVGYTGIRCVAELD